MPISKTISRALALNSSLGRNLAFFIGILLLASIWTLTRSSERAVYKAERSAINLSISQAWQAEDTFLQAELAIMDIRRTASSLD